MAHNLDMQVTAEGIESEAQLLFLQAKQCHYVQGYHLAPPQPQASGLPPAMAGRQARNLMMTTQI